MNNKLVYADYNPNDKKKDRFIIYKDYKHILHTGEEIIIPKGYVTDFASVPRIFWVIFPPHFYSYRKPSIIHDYLYTENKIILSRKESDKEFSELLKQNGAWCVTIFLFYSYVRLFGWIKWNKYKRF